MKKLILIFISVLTFSVCFGQRYEVWVRTSNNYNYVKRNYGFSNDSILATYSNPSLLFPSKETQFAWDNISDLKIRNKSKNQMGQLIGASAGFLGSFMVYNSLKKSAGEGAAVNLIMIVMLPTFTGIGTLAGHLATNKKTEIPIQGINSPEKNKLLKKSMKK